jgi:hypothetical protein
MRLGDCVIETELGSVDIGIRAQLGEIERGFFDRAGGPKAGLEGRPGTGAAAIRPAAPMAVSQSGSSETRRDAGQEVRP